MKQLTVISPPDGEALSLSAAKDYLRIGHEGEDALVADLIKAATARLETALDMALVSRVLSLQLGAWPRAMTRGGYVLPRGPVAELVSVTLVDGTGGETLVTERFALCDGRVALKPFVALPVLPEGGAVVVDYVAGYGAAADVPADLVQGLKDMVAAGYARAEMRVPESLLARRRVKL